MWLMQEVIYEFLKSWSRTLQMVPNVQARRSIAVHQIVVLIEAALGTMAKNIEKSERRRPESRLDRVSSTKHSTSTETPSDDIDDDDDEDVKRLVDVDHDGKTRTNDDQAACAKESSATNALTVLEKEACELARTALNRCENMLGKVTRDLYKWIESPTYQSPIVKNSAEAFVQRTRAQAGNQRPNVNSMMCTERSRSRRSCKHSRQMSKIVQFSVMANLMQTLADNVQAIYDLQPDPAARFSSLLILVRTLVAGAISAMVDSLIENELEDVVEGEQGSGHHPMKIVDILSGIDALRSRVLEVIDELIEHVSSPLVAPDTGFGRVVETVSAQRFTHVASVHATLMATHHSTSAAAAAAAAAAVTTTSTTSH